jgi:hypothetical protein
MTNDSWQWNLVRRELAAGTITEEQALLLAVLYQESNYSTRVIADFRAERACEWTGHDALFYVRTMQRRLKTLRDKGWFTSGYVRGEKVPYDIQMISEAQALTKELIQPSPERAERRATSASCGDGEAGGVALESPVEVLSLRVLNDKPQATS